MIMRIPILKSILRNLDWFEEAQKHHKAPEGTIFVGGINHRLKKEDWSEQKHPRADDGKFTSGSGGGSKKPSKTKRKLERRAEAASQGRVSGAIQTLLSGGSALDKIGWLNTSKPKEPEKKPESKPQQPEKKPEPEKPKPIDMSDVPKNKSLITGSVSVSYDTKIRNRNARFVGGEDSPSGEHVHNEDAGYIIVPNTENFIYVQTHSGKSGWYPDIYNNTRRTNYYPGSKEDALTDIAAHPGGPKADELYPTLADAIASNRSIPKNHNISAHTNKPPKTFDGAAVLEEYYRAHPEKRPPEVTPQQPEKPKAEEKPRPADKVKSAKDTIQENLKSGKLKRETVIAAVMSLHEQASAAKAKGDFKSSKDLMFQANVMIDAAEIKSYELIPSKRQNTPSQKPANTRRNPGNDPFAGDPLHDPLPRGYGIRSPAETERYMREHPYKPPKDSDYESDYKRRTGRDWDPTTA